MSTKKKEPASEMTLEKKEKGPDIQSRMETGKIEIMKVVEGIPGAEKLAELIERGKKKGKLSSSELLDVLEDMELGTDQMDKIYDTLENLGIETVGEDYIPDLADTAEPPVEEMEEIGYEDCFYGEGISLIEWADLVAEIIIGPESTQSPAILRDYLRDNALPSLAERVSLSDCPLRGMPV